MRSISEKIVSLPKIVSIVAKLKKQKKKVVTTNGVFDILHLGHITYLESAKKMGDILIVGINSDASVRRIKGPKRPLNSQKARAGCVAALECVDYVIIFEEDTPIQFLSAVKPHIHIKGGDYRGKEALIVEKNTINKNGGKIVLKEMVKEFSTTKLIEKIIEVYGK